MALHNAMSIAFSIQEIALTILFSMAVALSEATLDLNVPHFVMICQIQTSRAELASRLSIRVKITMPWRVVRWHGDVIILNLGLEEIPTSKRSNIMLQIPRWVYQVRVHIVTIVVVSLPNLRTRLTETPLEHFFPAETYGLGWAFIKQTIWPGSGIMEKAWDGPTGNLEREMINGEWLQELLWSGKVAGQASGMICQTMTAEFIMSSVNYQVPLVAEHFFQLIAGMITFS